MARNLRAGVEKRRIYAVEIIEQPAPKQQRFRYASEVDGSRSVGSIPGVHSSAELKTYPTIRVRGYRGPMLVELSLVNPEDKLVHPHGIVGNDPRYNNNKGVIYAFVDGPEVVFNNIGVVCVKSKTADNVTSVLMDRQKVKVDPLKGGFPHISDHRLINFNAVRLCFKVYIPECDILPEERADVNKYNIDLIPAVSSIVYDAKKLNELKIQYISKTAGPMYGGTEIVILCEKYTGTNPDVVFVDGEWEEKATIVMYHKQMALVVKSPPYKYPQCSRNVTVEVYLQRVTPRGVVERSAPAFSEFIPVSPKSHSPDISMNRPPGNYIELKQEKMTVMEQIQGAKVSNEDAQLIISNLLHLLELKFPVEYKYQSATGMASPSLNNTLGQQDNVQWPQQSTLGTSNTFNQPMNPSVNQDATNQYVDVNNTTAPTYNQLVDIAPSDNMMLYENTLEPNMSNVQRFAPVLNSGPSTSFHQNYDAMLASSFPSNPSDFSTLLPQQRTNMNFVDLNPTASTSYSQMPIVQSPISEDFGSTDTNFNTAIAVEDYLYFNENGIVSPEYQNMQSHQAVEKPNESIFMNNLGFEHRVDNLSDEFKKMSS